MGVRGEPVLGIILAGGRSRRMGGGDKVFRHIAGVAILRRVVDALAPQCDGLLISANGDPSRFADYRLPVVADDIAGFAGPLAGLIAALDRIAVGHPQIDCAVSMSGDTPFPPRDLVRRLHSVRLEQGADLAVASSGGRLHPTIALWPVALRHAMRTCLVDERQPRVRVFAERFSLAVAEWPVVPFDPFLNVNAPADVAAAEAIAAQIADIRPQ